MSEWWKDPEPGLPNLRGFDDSTGHLLSDEELDKEIAKLNMADLTDLRFKAMSVLKHARVMSRHQKKKDDPRSFLETRTSEQRKMFQLLGRLKMSEDFTAIVKERSTYQKQRTVLLTDIRFFGIPYIVEDHLWVPYNAKWERIEPFFQGAKVFLSGVPEKYRKGNGVNDYHLNPTKVIKIG